jgi:lysine-specific demethylase 8
MMQKAGAIEEISICSREQFYLEYILQDKPVIIKGMANAWPASSKWSISYFNEIIGDMEIEYRQSPSNLHPDLNQINIHQLHHDDLFKKSTLNYFLKKINHNQHKEFVFLCASGLPVFSKNNFNEALNALINDFEIPSLFMRSALISAGLWISPKNVISWLHYDKNGLHNLNAQIQGQKRVLLFSPQFVSNYYLYPYTTELVNFSQINIINPDYNKHPLFKNARYYEGILEAGDILYIPAYWLHSFEHLGATNINLNFWWDEQIKRSNPLLIRDKIFNSIHELLAPDKDPLIATLLSKQVPIIQSWISEIEKKLLT